MTQPIRTGDIDKVETTLSWQVTLADLAVHLGRSYGSGCTYRTVLVDRLAAIIRRATVGDPSTSSSPKLPEPGDCPVQYGSAFEHDRVPPRGHGG